MCEFCLLQPTPKRRKGISGAADTSDSVEVLSLPESYAGENQVCISNNINWKIYASSLYHQKGIILPLFIIPKQSISLFHFSRSFHVQE